jgi:hypothetical protein
VGHVRAIPQVDQAGQQSGNTMLEITYGGLESPFGGIDSSAPAAYIDPKCFADADGFLIVNNKLVAASYKPLPTPELWGGVALVQLLKEGTFYSSKLGQLNYALGYSLTSTSGTPVTVDFIFYLTLWNAATGAIVDNQVLNLKLFASKIESAPATLVLPVLMGETSDYIDSGNLNLNYGVSGVFVGNIALPYAPGESVAQIVANSVPIIAAASGSTGFTAAASSDGLSIILTAVTPGSAGNNLNVSDASASGTAGNSPAFYFPIAPSPSAWTALYGGADAFNQNPVQGPFDVATTEVGGVLYFANIGPFILKYSGLGAFTVSSVYAGVKVIKKFAGSLIGLGTITQLGTILQNADMIFSWSAANRLDEWSPIDANGNVTGAGFTQLADIGDVLIGLIVTNNTAFIIRSQGISYATAIQNGSDPFQFAHIGLADEGEGAQSRDLVCQYDQTGAYVGNSNIFQISGSISAIGQKIKAALFSALEGVTDFLSSASCAVFIGGDTFPVVSFMIGESIFTYNPSNGTWMKFTYTPVSHQIQAQLAVVYLNQVGRFSQSGSVLALQGKTGLIPAIVPPVSYVLTGGVPNVNSISGQSQITFPQEELLFGRDVTIDALYIALWGDVSEDTTIEFYFNGVLFSSLVLTTAIYNSLSGNPIENKIFPTGVTGTGVFTSHSPQLQIKIISLTDAGTASIEFSKIQMYASFEPNQRPV